MDKSNIKEWLKEICRWDRDDWFVKVIEDTSRFKNGKFKCNIYTHAHKYRITAILHPEENRKDYLGCTVSARKPRAGEDWTRGNDLPDGPYTHETWQEIKDAILAYELVKIARRVDVKTIEKKEATLLKQSTAEEKI